MNRKHFLFSSAAIMLGARQWTSEPHPELLYFKDDGVIPNNKFPLLLYRNAFTARGEKGAEWLEKTFLSNNWSNSWRNGIFTFQHYHSITHEALGIYNGEVEVLLGGDKGEKVNVKAGDIIVIPAGVGHKNLGDNNLGVVGAYPNGMPVDIMRGESGERPGVDRNIAAVPLPFTDPLLGEGKGLTKIWTPVKTS
jgi:uncharacterized protein YjlB